MADGEVADGGVRRRGCTFQKKDFFPEESLSAGEITEGSEWERDEEDAQLVGLDVVGSGIFVLTGLEAKEKAGPAVVLSFVISGVSALLWCFVTESSPLKFRLQ
ncbi:hypothetical protein KIW84_071580 [Lathyrus oleraceus]|uniref:Uncharacterized protein n=1 Tax=Pisum sativum TaxID=3888 RepID=A0A9D4VJD7_PEA|nr:hypothetical protein KIW84_071580 [Pisum sativum]